MFDKIVINKRGRIILKKRSRLWWIFCYQNGWFQHKKGRLLHGTDMFWRDPRRALLFKIKCRISIILTNAVRLYRKFIRRARSIKDESEVIHFIPGGVKPSLKILSIEELSKLSFKELCDLQYNWVLWYWQFTEEEKGVFEIIESHLETQRKNLLTLNFPQI